MIQKIKINVKSKSADIHIWMFHVSQSASHHCLTGMKLKLSKQMCINVVLPKRRAINPSFICLINFMYYRTEVKKKMWLKCRSSYWLKSCVYLRAWVLPVLLPVAVVKQPMKDNEKYLKLTFDEKKKPKYHFFYKSHITFISSHCSFSKTTDVSRQLNVQYKAERQMNVFTCLHSSVSMTTRW